MKGTAKNGTMSNIKPMEGGGAIASLSSGQYVFGDLSVAGTDIINFSHYYRADGTKVLLPKPCKVTTANLDLVDIAEGTPDPDPIPEVPQFPQSFTLSDPQGNKAEYVFVRVIE